MDEIKLGEWSCKVSPIGIVCKRATDNMEETTVVYTGYIPHDSHTEKLYELESKRNEMLMDSAHELLRVMKKDDKHLSVASELYDTLESFSQSLSIPASIAYLHSKGVI